MTLNSLSFHESREIDVIPMGRIAIDFNSNEIFRPMEETNTFTKYIGGSPANIAVGMARLGKKVGFIGCISDDQFGRYALNYFTNEGIDTSNIAVDKSGAPIGLAFTEIKSETESSILMYRDNVADLKISPEYISEEYIKNAKVILISGTALSKAPSREACFVAMEYAKKHNTLIVFDIDYRPYSWKSLKEVSVYYSMAARMSNMIIGSREEFDLMEALVCPESKSDSVSANTWFAYNAEILVIKHGKEGSNVYTKNGDVFKVRAFPVKLLKSFGGGDAYASALLYGLMEGWELEKSLEFASASAAMLVASHSCSAAMPTAHEIQQFILDKKDQNLDIVTQY